MFKSDDKVVVVANTEYPESEQSEELIGWKGVITHVYASGAVSVDFTECKGLYFAANELELVK